MKKTVKIVLIAGLVAAVGYSSFLSYRVWQLKTGRIIEVTVGDKRLVMTPEEFHKVFPPQNVVLPDKNKPEEVYTKFREAILNNDIEGALQYIAERKREQYRTGLAKNLETYKKLPEFAKLEKASNYDNDVQAGYIFKFNDERYTVTLEKTWDGYWLIYGI